MEKCQYKALRTDIAGQRSFWRAADGWIDMYKGCSYVSEVNVGTGVPKIAMEVCSMVYLACVWTRFYNLERGSLAGLLAQ
jgi:hypothetical protein